MSRSIAVAIAIATLAGSAGADPLDDPKPVKTTIEKITGWPIGSITPLPARIEAHNQVPPGWSTRVALPAAEKTVLYFEQGGRLDAHVQRFRLIAQKGGEVEIRALCQSACTLILGHIPRERLCFAEHARLNFHMASNLDGTPSLEHTNWMLGWYPTDVKAWLEARGGVQKMPHGNSFWTLPASELFKMGYRKCPD